MAQQVKVHATKTFDPSSDLRNLVVKQRKLTFVDCLLNSTLVLWHSTHTHTGVF